MSMSSAVTTTALEELPGAITAAITRLDEALGRPPFANPAPDAVVALARELAGLTHLAKDKNRLASLSRSQAVTSTLPILCAAIKGGSVDGTPCPVFTEALLDAFVPVCTLSTYPVHSILEDMEAALPGQSVALFALTLGSGALTQEKMRTVLGIPEPRAAKVKGKGGGSAKPKAAPGNVPAAPPQEPLCPALLKYMLGASLDEPCRGLLVSTFNTNPKFLKLVGDDGALAELILDVYGHVLLPTLKPASLFRCLDEHIIDHFVDLVHKHDERMLLLTDGQSLASPGVAAWSADRIARLCAAAGRRSVGAEDGYGSLVTAVFLAQVVSRDGATPDANLAHLWSAAYRAAAATFAAESGSLSTSQPSRGPSPFTAESSLHLAANTLQVSGSEERWLRPLSLLTTATWSAASSLFFLPEVASPAFSLGPLAKEATTLLGDIIIPSLRAKSAAHRKVPLQPQQQAHPPPAAAQGKAGGKKNKKGESGSKGGGGNQSSDDPSDGKVAIDSGAAPAPLPFTTYLHLSADVVALSSLLAGSGLASTQAVRALCQGYQFCCNFTAQQAMSGAMWEAHVNVVTQVAWQVRRLNATPGGSPSTLPTCITDALVSAVKAVSNPMWVAPYALEGLVQQHDQWRAAFFTQPLLDTLMAAFLVKRGASDSTGGSTATTTARAGAAASASLYPLRPAVVLGLTVAVMTDEQLRESVRRFSKSDAIDAMLPYLDSILDRYLSGAPSELARPPQQSRAASALTDAVDGTASIAARSIEAIQRLREVMSAEYQLKSDERQRKREVEADRRKELLRQRLEEEAALAADRRAFEKDQELVKRQKRKAVESVRQEYEKRQEARATRETLEKQQREVKRKEAVATLRQQNTQTGAEREAARIARRDRYQERMASLFRVSAFLEHLDLVPTRLMVIRNELHSVIDTISPDELLEFVVTGQRSIPADMVVESDDDRAGGAEGAAADKTVDVTDFWGDVSRDGGVEGVRLMHANVTQATARAPESTHSFHYRLSPLLDLFCYAAGDQPGALPQPLPALKLSLAAKVLPRSFLAMRGLTSVADGFMKLQERGLVTVQDGRARLSVLGYRYHCPYYNEEGMLEVRVQANQARIREALLRLRGQQRHQDDDSENSYDDDEDDDRILPEVEFGI